jgi:hypothetical protein
LFSHSSAGAKAISRRSRAHRSRKQQDKDLRTLLLLLNRWRVKSELVGFEFRKTANSVARVFFFRFKLCFGTCESSCGLQIRSGKKKWARAEKGELRRYDFSPERWIVRGLRGVSSRSESLVSRSVIILKG